MILSWDSVKSWLKSATVTTDPAFVYRCHICGYSSAYGAEWQRDRDALNHNQEHVL